MDEKKGSQGINSGCWAPEGTFLWKVVSFLLEIVQIIPLPKEETRILELIWWTNKRKKVNISEIRR